MTNPTPLLEGKNIAKLRRMIIRKRKLGAILNLYAHHSFAITVISMFLIVFGAMALQSYSDRQTLELAKTNALSAKTFYEGVMSSQKHMSVEIVEWSDEDIFGMIGSPIDPTVFDMHYLEYFGMAKKGDVLTFIWSSSENSSFQNCPTIFRKNGLYLNACGLEPLRPGGTK